MSLSVFSANICKVLRNYHLRVMTSAYSTVTPYEGEIIDPPETLELCDNNYRPRMNETIEQKKARLLYQSRKRGMLENDLILGTFVHKYLKTMDAKEMDEYDKLINLPSNDWDLYNWAVGKKPTPEQFECGVMELLKEHAKNINKEQRFKQPNLWED